MSEGMQAIKVLVPVDGSANSDRVIDHLLAELAAGTAMDMHLLNVQIPVDSGHARMFVSDEEVQSYHREEGEQALKSARQKLDAAGVEYHWHVAVGHVADTILRFAREQGAERIVMGTHGRTALAHLLLGSVASDVSRSATVPVTLIK
jgi:nucleotide-binding universal stress UspA family protein